MKIQFPVCQTSNRYRMTESQFIYQNMTAQPSSSRGASFSLAWSAPSLFHMPWWETKRHWITKEKEWDDSGTKEKLNTETEHFSILLEKKNRSVNISHYVALAAQLNLSEVTTEEN